MSNAEEKERLQLYLEKLKQENHTLNQQLMQTIHNPYENFVYEDFNATNGEAKEPIQSNQILNEIEKMRNEQKSKLRIIEENYFKLKKSGSPPKQLPIPQYSTTKPKLHSKTKRRNSTGEVLSEKLKEYSKHENEEKAKIAVTDVYPKLKSPRPTLFETTVIEPAHTKSSFLKWKKSIQSVSNSIPYTEEYSDNIYELSHMDDYETFKSIESNKSDRRKRFTIPRPFSFQYREAKKDKSIAQLRFEKYICLLQNEEEAELNRKFKAGVIPASTATARYEELLKERRDKSEEIRKISKQLTIENERPFSFFKRDKEKAKEKLEFIENYQKQLEESTKGEFHAKEVPAFVKTSLKAQFEAEEAKRREKIAIRARELMESSSLPKRMKLHEPKPLTATSFSFQPSIKGSVPDFSKLHKDFSELLRLKKVSKEPTKIEEFKFLKGTSRASSMRPSSAPPKSFTDSLTSKSIDFNESHKKRNTNSLYHSLVPEFDNAKKPAYTNATIVRESFVKKELLNREEQRRKKELENLEIQQKMQNRKKVVQSMENLREKLKLKLDLKGIYK